MPSRQSALAEYHWLHDDAWLILSWFLRMTGSKSVNTMYFCKPHPLQHQQLQAGAAHAFSENFNT